MELFQHLIKAREAQRTKAAKRRASQVFEFNWRSTGSEYVLGWPAAAALLNMKESSLAARLSTGKGKHCVRTANPVHGEQDVLTVSRMSNAKAENRMRGRPAKFIDRARLGDGFDDGIDLAPPARTMPKTRNRRTDDKR